MAYFFVIFLTPLLLFSSRSLAEQNILVISSSTANVYQQTLDSLREELTNRGHLKTVTLNHYFLADIEEGMTPADSSTSLVVSIGSAAASYALQHYENTPLLLGFITRNAFESISAQSRSRTDVSAVFMDQSLDRLLNLAALLGREQKPLKVGMLNQNSSELERSLSRRNPALDALEVDSASLTKINNPIKTIEPLMKASDIFIVRPNTSSFNRLVAKLVLQLSMRYKTPVIGFSKNYAQAGALLSLYASPKDIGSDLASTLGHWLESPKPADATIKEGAQFSLSVNHNVAKKMGVDVNLQALERALKSIERAAP